MLELDRVETHVVCGVGRVLDADHVVDNGGGLVRIDHPVMDKIFFTSLC